MAIAHVASAVAARRIVFGEARARSRASTPAPEEAEFLLVAGTSVLARHLQQEVLGRVDLAWRQSAQGQIYVQKAWDIANQAAEKNAAASKGLGAAGASTHGAAAAWIGGPEAVGSEERFEREMKKYFRTHCDQAYGGQFLVESARHL